MADNTMSETTSMIAAYYADNHEHDHLISANITASSFTEDESIDLPTPTTPRSSRLGTSFDLPTPTASTSGGFTFTSTGYSHIEDDTQTTYVYFPAPSISLLPLDSASSSVPSSPPSLTYDTTISTNADSTNLTEDSEDFTASSVFSLATPPFHTPMEIHFLPFQPGTPGTPLPARTGLSMLSSPLVLHGTPSPGASVPRRVLRLRDEDEPSTTNLTLSGLRMRYHAGGAGGDQGGSAAEDARMASDNQEQMGNEIAEDETIGSVAWENVFRRLVLPAEENNARLEHEDEGASDTEHEDSDTTMSSLLEGFSCVDLTDDLGDAENGEMIDGPEALDKDGNSGIAEMDEEQEQLSDLPSDCDDASIHDDQDLEEDAGEGAHEYPHASQHETYTESDPSPLLLVLYNRQNSLQQIADISGNGQERHIQGQIANHQPLQPEPSYPAAVHLGVAQGSVSQHNFGVSLRSGVISSLASLTAGYSDYQLMLLDWQAPMPSFAVIRPMTGKMADLRALSLEDEKGELKAYGSGEMEYQMK